MGFRTRRAENNSFDTPQEMYKDYKKRKINGTLDYQSKMIESYMEKAYSKSDVAFELPTGSGKTLIGLLIGEFRRRKNKEKVVYICPNNQLVNQVVEKAINTFGIKVNGFTGSRKFYSPEAISNYNTAETIAVTNYSSLFNTNSFFSDADIIIFDDAHSSENYIAKNWSLMINRNEDEELYFSLLENLKSEIEITNYERMSDANPQQEDLEWYDKLPNIRYGNKIEDIFSIVESHVHDTNLKYSWSNIRNHLHACNMYLSWNGILIRPYIPPTMTHKAFSHAKQRIYMSATLGESGELERITGVKNITKLPMIADWDKKSIGRRFFIFPNASFNTSLNQEILLKINETTNRKLFLVQDDKSVKNIKKFIEDNTNTKVFLSKDIELSKKDFVESDNALAILANRYDGIDMDGDACHMLILGNLPSATHLQEKFLTNRMAAAVLFNERVKTRIVQAVGRCTRSDVDYAAVVVFGNDLENALISPKKILNYPPELRAELEFGFDQSTKHKDVNELVELLELFFERGEEWENAEQDIISLRDEYIAEDYKSKEAENFSSLRDTVKHEVAFQYALWKEDYDEALNQIDLILPKLDGGALQGYKGFWNYFAGYVAYQIYDSGEKSYYEVSRNYYKEASKSTKTIKWFNKLLDKKEIESGIEVNSNLSSVIERIESQLIALGTRNNRKFEAKAKEIISLLMSGEGKKFERGHQQLGELLGYVSENPKGSADPDPWWLIDETLCIVSEDKIYESAEKAIPAVDVRQALTHENWIVENVPFLRKDAIILTVMITNSSSIEESARIHGKKIWHIDMDDFVAWAISAIEAIRKLRRSFMEKGDNVWRIEAQETLKTAKVTPNDFIGFIQQRRLLDL